MHFFSLHVDFRARIQFWRATSGCSRCQQQYRVREICVRLQIPRSRIQYHLPGKRLVPQSDTVKLRGFLPYHNNFHCLRSLHVSRLYEGAHHCASIKHYIYCAFVFAQLSLAVKYTCAYDDVSVNKHPAERKYDCSLLTYNDHSCSSRVNQ